jgi:hypothetical protein
MITTGRTGTTFWYVNKRSKFTVVQRRLACIFSELKLTREIHQGDNDTSDGKPLNSAEDRLFSTAMAMNALLDTWTQNNGSCQRKWLANTPSDVQNVVNMAASWLNTFILGNKYLPGKTSEISKFVKFFTCV